MKGKIIGALLMVMAIAGTAAAYQPCGDAPRHRGYRDGRPELSQEERVQFETMRNLRGEIRAELGKEKPDKAKARKLFEKELDLREKFAAARFDDCLANHGKDDNCRWRSFGGRDKNFRGESNSAWRELREEMSKDYPNKAKARELYQEAAKTRREYAKARFEEVLKDPSKFMQRLSPRHGHGHGYHDGHRYYCGSHRDCPDCHRQGTCPQHNCVIN